MRPFRFSFFLLLMAVCVVMVPAQQSTTTTTNNSGTPGSEATKPADALKPTDIIAKVGDQVLTVADIEKQFEIVPPQFASHFNDNPEQKELFIQSQVDKLLFSKEARTQNYPNRPDIKEKIDTYIERTLYSEYAKTITDPIKVSDEEVKAYYEAHKEQYTLPERVKARHILLADAEKAAKVKIDIEKGASWDDVAKNFSTDRRTANRGGDLGLFSRNGLGADYKAVEEAAFTMNPGEIRGPVQTRQGFHIIKLEEKRPKEIHPFQDVQFQIQDQLLRQRRKDRMAAERETLMRKYDAFIDKDKISKIRVNSSKAATPNKPPAETKSPATPPPAGKN